MNLFKILNSSLWVLGVGLADVPVELALLTEVESGYRTSANGWSNLEVGLLPVVSDIRSEEKLVVSASASAAIYFSLVWELLAAASAGLGCSKVSEAFGSAELWASPKLLVRLNNNDVSASSSCFASSASVSCCSVIVFDLFIP